MRLVDYIYNNLPKVYRVKDTKKYLKKYIESVIEGGALTLQKEIKGLENLIDPDKCPTVLLPIMCESYGIYFDPNVSEKFIRKMIKNSGEILSIKSTLAMIEFMVKELSGFRVLTNKEEIDGKPYFVIRATIYEDENNELLTNQESIVNYIEKYVPPKVNLKIYISYEFLDNALIYVTEKDENIKTRTKEKDDLNVQIKSSQSIFLKNKYLEKSMVVDTDVFCITNDKLQTPFFIANGVSGYDIIKEREKEELIIFR